MSENKYEERVRQRAEEFYNEARRALGIVEPEGSDDKEESISKLFIPLGKMAIYREAEAYKAGFDAGYFDKVADDVTIDEWLQALGYLPITAPAPVPGQK